MPINNRSKRRDPDSRRVTKFAFLTFGSAAVLILLVVTAYIATIQYTGLDEETLCSADPESITVLVVDVTDPMNLPQRQDFRNQLEILRDEIPQDGQFSIFRVDATSEALLEPVIVRCNPGNGTDEDIITGNPEEARQLWEEQYVAPLDEAFASLASASGSDTSPILESIQSVALTEMQTQDARNKRRRLVLASDLLQNTSDISFYEGLPSENELIESDAFQRVRTNLRGIELDLWMLQRDDSRETQRRALIELWDSLISSQGGTVNRVYRVSG